MSVDTLLEWGQYFLYLNFVSLLIAFGFSLQVKKLNSTVLSLSIMLIFNFIMTSYTPHLYQLSQAQNADQVHLFRIVWYLGFALCDLAIVSGIFYGHMKFQLRRSFCANAVVLVYSLKMLLHIVRYFEREFFGSEHLAAFYKATIPLINMTLAASVLGFILTLLISALLHKTLNLRRVQWNI